MDDRTVRAQLLAVEVLLAEPGLLGNDALEADLYILREKLRGRLLAGWVWEVMGGYWAWLIVSLGMGFPGIRGLLVFRPETGGRLSDLAQALLRGDSTLSAGERELIAACMSRQNECEYCAVPG